MIQRTQALARPLRQASRSMLSFAPVATMEQAFPMPQLSFPMPSLPTPPFPSFPMPFAQKPQTTVDEKKEATPLMQVADNLFAKLEGFNVGGSIKDRAVM